MASSAEHLRAICQQLLTSKRNQYGNDHELEIRFGTRGSGITRIDFDNVVKKLKSTGFSAEVERGETVLKISPEITSIAGARVEISGVHNVQTYCTGNKVADIINTHPKDVFMMKKSRPQQGVTSAEFPDFNFRVIYALESPIKMHSNIVDAVDSAQKTFRYTNRVSFTHPEYPFRVDMSIVKTSLKSGRNYVSASTVSESGVFNNTEIYEIEVETLNDAARLKYTAPEAFAKDIQHMAIVIMSGIQQSNYPISIKEQESIAHEYSSLIGIQLNEKIGKLQNTSFIGPNSKTLKLSNVQKDDVDTVANITIPYTFCVTDKADGSRHMLFIASTGRIYLIDTNMRIVYTGAKTKQQYAKTLLDGELIIHDKDGGYINTFATFDVYFKNGENVRAHPFMYTSLIPEKKYTEEECRLNILSHIIEDINITSPLKITKKMFYPLQYNAPQSKVTNETIFKACKWIFNQNKSGAYPYNIDGLIFTPTLYGVGSNKFNEAGPLRKITWDVSLKWKPVEYNTVDFLVTTVKKGGSELGEDIITPIFEEGTNMLQTTQYNQYKTLVLRVGYNEAKDGYANPCQTVYNGDEVVDIKGGDYRPVQFYPSEPADPSAGLCNVMLKADAMGTQQMFTEESEIFEDKTIVEFRYDITREGMWRWIPLRVRYDKTREYRKGMRNFGNAYAVANSIWNSIHFPVTTEMISTGENIPSEINDIDVYYKNSNRKTLSQHMRDFHNLVVKRDLIQGVSKKGDILIDFACGKGGDLPKWIAAQLSFVFGIDISKDNIENKRNGACARYLNYKADHKRVPAALFVTGDSALNIRSGEAMITAKSLAITKTVFGTLPKTPDLGAAVEAQYAKGANGFNVASCQFAIHYLFKNAVVFYNFIQNVAECTKINGYFIGTSYDGQRIFDMLRTKDTESIYVGDAKVWEIKRDYASGGNFPDDVRSLGHQVTVYQDSINQDIAEYLVNFDFLIKTMETYGFVVLSAEEAKKMSVPHGTGTFEDIYNMMMKRTQAQKKEYGGAAQMESYEKRISFLNRYFIFKKVRTVDAAALTAEAIDIVPSGYEMPLINTDSSNNTDLIEAMALTQRDDTVVISEE